MDTKFSNFFMHTDYIYGVQNAGILQKKSSYFRTTKILVTIIKSPKLIFPRNLLNVIELVRFLLNLINN